MGGQHASESKTGVVNVGLVIQGRYKVSCSSFLLHTSVEDSEWGLGIQITPGEVSNIQ